ncbi:T9SS type A sorting domain-containing protein [candidate division KSB1 bacterium]|nr:T9SS type A sorting domain-containing protein [candidate division KSB1 bacterium]
MKKVTIFLMMALFASQCLAWNPLRNYETITLTGTKVPSFVGLPVNEIYLFAYNASINSWNQIQVQIDELAADGSIFVNVNDLNGILDEIEEIIFLVKDAGDKAPENKLIEDNIYNPRYEIELNDPLDSFDTRYVYLYHSTTLVPDSNLPTYMNYTGSTNGNDQVQAYGYLEGHEIGVPRTWQISTNNGGTNEDILDYQKARVNALGGTNITEDDLQAKQPSISVRTGPIRITRRVTFSVAVLGGIYNFEISFHKRYYPFAINSWAGKTLTSTMEIDLIRQSYDLNNNAIGMEFYNQNNHTVINGVSESINANVRVDPDWDWYLVTGSKGSFVNILQVDNLGSRQRLYYKDNKATDGNDTGDKRSIGDIGVILDGSQLIGKYNSQMFLYFLPANQDSIVGPEIYANKLTPLNVQPQLQYPVFVDIPKTSVKQGLYVSIPVNIAGTTGINVQDVVLKIDYDPSILQWQGTTNEGTLTASWDQPQVTVNSGNLNIHLHGSSALTGNGALLNLQFRALGESGSVAALHISQLTLTTDKPLAASIEDGSVTVLPPDDVAVTVPEYAQEEGLEQWVAVVVDDVSGLEIKSVFVRLIYDPEVILPIESATDKTIAESWNQFSSSSPQPGIYEFTMSGDEPLTGEGVLFYTKFQIVGNPNDSSPLRLDDVTFNDGFPVSVKSNGVLTVLRTTLVTLTLQDTTLFSGAICDIPIQVEDVTDLGLQEVKMVIEYDGTVLDILELEQNGTLSEQAETADLNLLENAVEIKVAKQSGFSGAGTLIKIQAHVIGLPDKTTNLHFAQVSVSPLQLTTVANDGIVTVIPGEITLSLPDTTSSSGTQVTVPLMISDVSELNIKKITMQITYDNTVLDASGYSIAGTLVENWASISVGDIINRVNIVMSGDDALQGEGILLFIKFNVIGSIGESSTLTIYNPRIQNANITKVNGSIAVSAVVPVELSLFDATVNGQAVSLRWATASETNNLRFEIQRKLVDTDVWQSLGFVKGNGTTTATHEYRFDDSLVDPGSYEYRLKQIDTNGSFEYSNAIRIEITAPEKWQLAQNYPNPFNTMTRIDYQMPVADFITIRIYNLLGREIRTLVQQRQTAGFHSVVWDGKDDNGSVMPSGIYIYQLKSRASTLSQKLMLLE